MSIRTSTAWLSTLALGGGVLVSSVLYYRMMRRFRDDMEQIRNDLGKLPCQTFVTSKYKNKVNIQYMERHGSNEDHVCLVLHPSGGGCDQGLLLGELLLPDNVRIIAPSRIGYLKTTATNDDYQSSIDKSIQDEAEAMMELLTNCLGPSSKVSILACSAAGILAIELADDFPTEFHS